MNYDYLIDAKPSIARKLVQLSKIANIDLDEEIKRIAESGLVSDELWSQLPVPLSSEQKRSVQDLLDHELRAVLLGNNRSIVRSTILSAFRLSNAKQIVLISEDGMEWAIAARLFGLRVGTSPSETCDVLVLKASDQIVTPEVASEDRRANALLVMETRSIFQAPGRLSPIHMAVRDFPKSVLVVEPKTDSDGGSWFNQPDTSNAADILHSGTMVNDLLVNNPVRRRAALAPRGFVNNHPRDLSFLYNVITHLVDQE